MRQEPNETPSSPWPKRVRSLATYLILVYLGLLVILYTAQHSLIFVPSEELFVPPEYAAWKIEDVTLSVGDETTHGWYVPAQGASRGVILFSHGNAGNIGHRIESLRIFRELGFDTLIYDYGGYGLSTGSPSEKRCYDDIRAAWTYLIKTRGFESNDIVLFGRSLGGGTTAQLATEVQPAAVILESVFTSIPDMAQQQFPIFPAHLLVRHRFDTVSKVAGITASILHIHSPDDDIIPFSHGQKLFQSSTEPKEFLEIKGTHNGGFYTSGTIYIKGLERFLQGIQ